ncbi:MAG: sigma-70 family RNA polymerase sigma factor [Pseudomonadales bacterium]
MVESAVNSSPDDMRQPSGPRSVDVRQFRDSNRKRGTMQADDANKERAIDEWAPLMPRIAEQRDRRAFAELFAHFAPKVKSFGMMLRSQYTSPEMADELVQDVMLKVWMKAGSFNPEKASVSTWIFTIARNCRTDYLRKLKRIDSPLTADDLWPMAEEEAPYASLEQRRVEKTIRGAIEALPAEQADVLKQIYIDGKTHSEVAEASGLPLGTVKSRVRLAMGKLRINVGEELAEFSNASMLESD